MDIKREKIAKGIKEALKEKGKRKFEQTVELIINVRGIDFSKPENRINLNITLPHGKGKENKVVVIADENTVHEVKKMGIEALTIEEVEEIAKDKKKAKKFVKERDVFLIKPELIGAVAKAIGKFLGQAGKSPTPLIGDIQKAIEKAKKTITIKTKGKYMPVIQAPIGKENFKEEQLVENAETVIEAITRKIPQGNIKNIYFKLTMGKPVKIS